MFGSKLKTENGNPLKKIVKWKITVIIVFFISVNEDYYLRYIKKDKDQPNFNLTGVLWAFEQWVEHNWGRK